MKPHGIPEFRSIPIVATGDHACAYLPDTRSRTLFVDPRQPLNMQVYSQLIDQGFRRSGEYVYRPGCRSCNECKSLRIPVAEFELARKHHRCLKANGDVRIHVQPPVFKEEHFALYRRYIASRHTGSEMADPSSSQYMDFLTASWCSSLFYEFRERDRLLAVSVVDELINGLSAVYTFYEPDLPKRSLGVLSVVWLIGESRRLGLRYLYLGYWIERSEKMRYKSHYLPHEIYEDGSWIRIARSD